MTNRAIITNTLFSMGLVAAIFGFVFVGWPEIETKGQREITGARVFQNTGFLKDYSETNQKEIRKEIIICEFPVIIPPPLSEFDEPARLIFPSGKITPSDSGFSGTPLEIVEACTLYHAYPSMISVEEAERQRKQNPSDPEKGSNWDYEPQFQNFNEITQKIEYPQALLDAEITGKTIIRVKVGIDGEIKEHQVIREFHPLMTEEIEKHLPDLFCKPCWRGPQTEPVWMTIPFIIDIKK